jgi:proline dehydrogenase
MTLLDRFVVGAMPMVPKWMIGKVAARYIAGASKTDAVNCIRELNQKGFRCTVDVLGEFVTDQQEAEKTTRAYVDFLDTIAAEKLDTNISIKLTAFGLSIDPQFCRKSIRRVTESAAQKNIFVRIDIEDSPYTTETFKVYEEFRREFRVGVAIQAYLRRSLDDTKRLMDGGASNYRLCKGIYVEPEAIAFKEKDEIRKNFVALLDAMFKGGAYVGIATHDEVLVAEAENLIAKYSLPKDRYEFQMLLGVRHELRNQIHERGHFLRVYVPFGDSWYGYCTRRLKENPAIGGYVFKAMLGFGG